MQHMTDMRHPAASPSMLPQRPPEPYQQGSIRMDLEYSDLWRSFHQIGTEMVITKSGRRMFPYCNVSVSGLIPYAKYVIMVDMMPVDNSRYKWNNEKWEVAGKAEPQLPCRTYVHPDSPALGSHWMKQAISFLKLKLTNNPLDQRGHIILHSMHRYMPCFHVVQADDLYTMRWSIFQTFTFPETSFTAVTVYQNNKITKLKINHNPFAKGFRDEGTHSKRNRAQKLCTESSSKKNKTSYKESEFQCYSADIPRLPYNPHREENMLLSKDMMMSQDEHTSPWGVELDSAHSLHAESIMDYTNSEQLVPEQAGYLSNRGHKLEKMPSPSGADIRTDEGSFNPVPSDMATVPEQELSRSLPSTSVSSVESKTSDFTLTTIGVCSKPRHHSYTHYYTEQPLGTWSGSLPGQYSSSAYPSPHPHPFPHHIVPEISQHPSRYHQCKVAEWSQYSLFAYSC